MFTAPALGLDGDRTLRRWLARSWTQLARVFGLGPLLGTRHFCAVVSSL